MIGFSEFKNEDYIIFEYFDFSLDNILSKLLIKEKLFVVNEVANGIKTLHDSNYYHNDIKSSNILVISI
jgi:serine/threonine protein kinase